MVTLMSKSVWDLLDEKAVSDEDLNTLVKLSLKEVDYNERAHTSSMEAFQHFKYKYGCHNLSVLLRKAYQLGTIPAMSFLYFSEVFLTYFRFVSKEKLYTSAEFNKSIDAIIHYIDKLNHKPISLEDGKIIVTKKDVVSELVASHFISLNETEFAWRTISYNSVSITITDKIDFLREMYVKIEAILKQKPEYKDIKTFRYLKRLLNYLRHHQTVDKKVKEIDDNLEYYCDFAYNTSLECILKYQNDLKLNNNITVLDKINNTSKNK